MAKTDNLTDFLTDVANAIREKKGTTNPINPQDFASEILNIESGNENMARQQRVTYIRRTNQGYIDTGVSGANSNLRIKVKYSIRTFPSAYWMFIGAYTNENANATRILFYGRNSILASLNSKAASSISLTRSPKATGIVYTDEIYPSSSTSFGLNANGTEKSLNRTNGDALEGNIRIFAAGTDTVDIDLYECQIYDGSTLIRNFIPDYQNEQFGLYDVISGAFYSSANDGQFTGEIINFDLRETTVK